LDREVYEGDDPDDPIKVGDKVRFKQHAAWLEWAGKERLGLRWAYPMPGKPQEFGFVVRKLDADTFWVRPRWKSKDFIMELYASELELVVKCNKL
jgi:hypothetical protein